LVEGVNHASGPAVEVRGNVVTRDTTTSMPAIILYFGLGAVRVVGNTISGGGGGGIVVDGSAWVYAADSVRLDSNSVQQAAGTGIEALNLGTTPLRLTYNLVADNAGSGMLMYSPFTATYNTVVRNRGTGVFDNTSGPSSFRLGNVVGNLPYGVRTNAASMAADSNWWGRSQGPKCAAGCDPTTTATGDSIYGNAVFAPVVDTGVVAGAPQIPAPPAAPIARLAARAFAVPPAPKAAQDARRLWVAPRAAQPAPRPIVPRAMKPGGRPSGHHVPVWKTGGQQ
jgi:hypothetical protein